MGNAADNHWRILGSEQVPPGRRDQVLKDIARALLSNHSAGIDATQRGGIDPYDSRLGSARRDVWDRQRRA